MVGLWLWSRNESPVIAKEVAWFSIPEEGAAKLQQDQDQVIWLGRCCPSWLCPLGQIINRKYCLHHLRDTIRWKWTYLCASRHWQLHHDNTPTHASYLMQSLLVKHQITQVTHPPYSPDLVPCDFWIFPKLKSPLRGKRFQTVNEIQENVMQQLMTIPIKDFTECFEQWERC